MKAWPWVLQRYGTCCMIRCNISSTIIQNTTTKVTGNVNVHVCKPSPWRRDRFTCTSYHLSCTDFSNTLRNCPKKLIFSSCISCSFCSFFSYFSSFLSTNSLNRETNSLLSLGGFFLGFFCFMLFCSSCSSLAVLSDDSSNFLTVGHSWFFRLISFY